MKHAIHEMGISWEGGAGEGFSSRSLGLLERFTETALTLQPFH